MFIVFFQVLSNALINEAREGVHEASTVICHTGVLSAVMFKNALDLGSEFVEELVRIRIVHGPILPKTPRWGDLV
jgi:hypothetical protein